MNNESKRIREMLDERGIKWTAYEKECNLEFEGFYDTRWDANGVRWSYLEVNGKASLSLVGGMDVELTPEQAIAATLGGRTLTAHDVWEAVGNHGVSQLQAIAEELNATLGGEVNGETSDGYHTFNELYHHRAVLFSVIVANNRGLAWKAKKHHDGTMYDGMFIVGIDTPWGQASYHYDIDPYWEMFDCMELVYAPIWDGHTPDEAIERIGKLATLGGGECEVECFDDGVDEGMDGEWISYAPPTWYLSCGHTAEGSECPPLCPTCGKAVKR
ncbi:MAG: hypothetical protein IJ087_01445 [Eggerthellaceae bacterium]|nr:hypothetical protein [Eggerthellaceae bacterium]